MVETRIVIVCSQCGAFWDPAADLHRAGTRAMTIIDSNRTYIAVVSCCQTARS